MPNAEEIDIINGLKAGGRERQRFETILWQRFSHFIQWGVTKYNLPYDDIRLAYDDAICSVILNIVSGKYEEQSSALLKTYAEAIFRHKCLDYFGRTGGKNGSQDNSKKNIKNPQPISESLSELLPSGLKNTVEKLIEQEQSAKMSLCLDRIGQPCKDVLILFGGDYKDKEIADLLGYSSSDVVKQTRYRCMEKLSKMYRSM